METEIFLLILTLAAVTYAVRVAGHVIILMFRSIPPRVEAALDAVPAAVLITLVVPVAMTSGWKEAVTIVAAALVGLRFGILGVLIFGIALIAGLRYVFA